MEAPAPRARRPSCKALRREARRRTRGNPGSAHTHTTPNHYHYYQLKQQHPPGRRRHIQAATRHKTQDKFATERCVVRFADAASQPFGEGACGIPSSSASIVPRHPGFQGMLARPPRCQRRNSRIHLRTLAGGPARRWRVGKRSGEAFYHVQSQVKNQVHWSSSLAHGRPAPGCWWLPHTACAAGGRTRNNRQATGESCAQRGGGDFRVWGSLLVQFVHKGAHTTSLRGGDSSSTERWSGKHMQSLLIRERVCSLDPHGGSLMRYALWSPASARK